MIVTWAAITMLSFGNVLDWQSLINNPEKCGYLDGKGNLDSQPVLQLRKLLKELMELVSRQLLQVFLC